MISESLKCDKCSFSSNEDVVFRHHILVSHVPGYECPECKSVIKSDDPAIDCSKCENYFHKKCTKPAQPHQPHIKPNEWMCHFCIPHCEICHFEASNDQALNYHMLNNHCPDYSVQCEICEKRFNYEYNLQSHMISHFQELPQSLTENPNCERCGETFASMTELKEHNTEHLRFDALNTCQTCGTMINVKELSLTCDNCQFSFHKKCTDLKKAGRNWKPSIWNCQFCTPTVTENEIVTQDQNNDEDTTEKQTEISNFPPKLAAKHRKSNTVNCAHPEKEFLESQINTLKSIVAKREAELKKIEESDKLKAKKIMLLEAQLNEARKSACATDTNPSCEENSKSLVCLEKKTNHLEHEIAVLFTKIESQNYNEIAPKSTPPSVSVSVYTCHECDSEFAQKEELKKHIFSSHTHIFSNGRAHVTERSFVRENHKEHAHLPQFKCINCNYNTDIEKDLEEHANRYHMKCKQCSYRAIHNKDMRRHINTMHPEPFQCKECDFEARTKEELDQHITFVHTLPAANNCNSCEFTTGSQKNLAQHIQQQHHQQRTRIFSSSRIFTQSQQPHQQMFRPWSLVTDISPATSSQKTSTEKTKSQ